MERFLVDHPELGGDTAGLFGGVTSAESLLEPVPESGLTRRFGDGILALGRSFR
jgi:hypothetical protein